MIVKGTVARQRSTPLGTPGAMSLANGFSANTLELPWHDNERGVSCTAPGVDRGRVWFSPSLKRLVIRYEDRNGRKDCLVHNGNFAAEERDIDGDGAPEVTQVHGCTEVGRGYGDILRKDGKSQWGIKSSGPTLAALIESLRAKPGEMAARYVDGVGYHDVEIEYSWAEGCEP